MPPLHRWDVTPDEAAALQIELAGHVDVTHPLTAWNLVAGADTAYNRFSDTMHASIVVWSRSKECIVETADEVSRATFPYVPGLFSFREAPALLAAFAKLTCRPDVLVCDAHGLAHPRRFGLACHVGLWLGVPTFGCAKSRLHGDYTPPADVAGAVSPLTDGPDTIGAVVRTVAGVKPVFVSAGHGIDLPSAVAVTLSCVRNYRIPEPTRQADIRVDQLRRESGDPTA